MASLDFISTHTVSIIQTKWNQSNHTTYLIFVSILTEHRHNSVSHSIPIKYQTESQPEENLILFISSIVYLAFVGAHFVQIYRISNLLHFVDCLCDYLVV